MSPRRAKKAAKRAARNQERERKEIRLDDLKAIVERARASLSDDDHEELLSAVETLAFLTQELEAKGASIKRLRRLIFGPSTEKTSKVTGGQDGEKDKAGGDSSTDENGDAGNSTGAAGADKKDKKKRKGHGRNGAAAYRGAKKVPVPHESFERGARCPACEKGKLYPLEAPAVLVRVTGMAPLGATVYELERLRCNLCGEIFTARPPPGVGDVKYDETAASMIGLLKYGSGLPFNRLERLQRNMGIPLPAATQWEVVERAAGLVAPAHEEIIRQAAQGEVLHNDDTTMKILELGGERQDAAADDDLPEERTGVFTSGIVSTGADHRIALFFTGRKHAGENLADVLARRAAELGPPIQMCDALSRNTAGDMETILANCTSHARRRFVEVIDNFPDECRHVLETLRDVYKNDAIAKQREMSPDQRLRFHQTESGPLMEDLEKWFVQQFEDKLVEPNSTLGDAFSYMQKHWDALTLFLRVPGAPLDNNICERALKKAILHRKNSLFYKTLNGAHVGDTFMSLIHTAELYGADPFDYLVALQRHADQVSRNPAEWMPWNYQETCARLASDS